MKRFLKNSIVFLAGLSLTGTILAFVPAPVGVGGSTGNAADSLSSPTYIRNSITYTKNFPFIKYERNFIEWETPASMATFYSKLKNSSKKKVKVLHIGDSHIQADMFTGATREKLQAVFGYGGRGIVFPYAAAQTHSAYDYRTWKTGNWNSARNVNREPELELGISGVTIQTSDVKSSFGISFQPGFIRENFKTVKIYCKKSAESFDLLFKYAPNAEPVIIDCNASDGKPYAEITIPVNSNDFEFSLVQNNPEQKYFECYGILIESDKDAGVLYNSVGINGAGLKSILRSARFAQQVAEMRPDLFILDLGANDFYNGYYNEEELSADLNQIIDIVKTASPGSSFIISCSQDIFARKHNIGECANYATLTKNVAFSRQLAHYNYYQVSGGRYSMLKWQSHGLSKKDRVHLSNDGYALKGELFANAILNSYYRFLQADGKRSLVVNDVLADTSLYGKMAVIEETPSPAVDPEKEKDPQKAADKDEFSNARVKKSVKKVAFHKVRRGESLGIIAEKYDVSVTDIRKWNRLRGSNIQTGQKLKIYRVQTVYVAERSKGLTAPPKPKKETTAKAKPAKAKKGGGHTHIVQKGETLFSIAKKYNTTVDQLKKLNGLKSNAIKPGQTLRLK